MNGAETMRSQSGGGRWQVIVERRLAVGEVVNRSSGATSARPAIFETLARARQLQPRRIE
jgi:hypothetical protein